MPDSHCSRVYLDEPNRVPQTMGMEDAAWEAVLCLVASSQAERLRARVVMEGCRLTQVTWSHETRAGEQESSKRGSALTPNMA